MNEIKVDLSTFTERALGCIFWIINSYFIVFHLFQQNHIFFFNLDFVPDSSVGKESACNAGDPGSIPGSGRSAGEGRGYPLQYSWASLVAQLVNNPPAMWETWV